VLEAPADMAALRERGEKSYVLINRRDLRKIPAVRPEWIVASDAPIEARWHLVEFNPRAIEDEHRDKSGLPR
jgi:hypothetical protein